jgi:hypothetical protein
MTRILRLLTIGLMSACTPTLDWRDVRPDGAELSSLFPCKPEGHTRQLPLAGHPVALSLYRCSAGGATYAVAFADMVDPARVGPALAALGGAAVGNINADAPTVSPLQVPGMTPNEQARRLGFAGRGPEGRSLQGRVALFARGTRVYQATVIGEQLDANAVETFFGALRLPT